MVQNMAAVLENQEKFLVIRLNALTLLFQCLFMHVKYANYD